jgi:DNA-binding transcriptional ArsR family regulator
MIADASRSRMLAYLLDGEFASAGELARAASVSAATASAHLAQLLDGGLLVCEPRGRHRYYRLADGEVAQALSALALVAERGAHARAWASPQRQRLQAARCCYGHLAGALGVQLMQGLLTQRWLQPAGAEFVLTKLGQQGLAALGLPPTDWQGPSRSRLAYGCLDWSERRDHLAGRLARALLSHALAQGWLRRLDGERALVLTPTGRRRLAPLIAGD